MFPVKGILKELHNVVPYGILGSKACIDPTFIIRYKTAAG